MPTIRMLLALLVAAGKIQLLRGTKALTPKASGLKPGHKAILRAVFARSLGKGTYTVKRRALADDGHHESGSWTFKVS